MNRKKSAAFRKVHCSLRGNIVKWHRQWLFSTSDVIPACDPICYRVITFCDLITYEIIIFICCIDDSLFPPHHNSKGNITPTFCLRSPLVQVLLRVLRYVWMMVVVSPLLQILVRTEEQHKMNFMCCRSIIIIIKEVLINCCAGKKAEEPFFLYSSTHFMKDFSCYEEEDCGELELGKHVFVPFAFWQSWQCQYSTLPTTSCR